jgi:outer membrane protein assembly factor BamA
MAWTACKYPGFIRNCLLWLLPLLWILQGCHLRRLVPEKEYLLVRNHIEVKNKPRDFPEVSSQVLHRPNKRIVFGVFPFYLWLHKKGTNFRKPEKSESVAWRKKLREDIGEAPVLLDTSLAALSARNLSKFLFNQGYFNNCVNYDWSGKRRKAQVHYRIDPGRRFTLGRIVLDCKDTQLQRILLPELESPHFRTGKPMIFEALDAERNRIAKALRNQGYFSFTRDNIRFELDTAEARADVKVQISNMADGSRHKARVIRSVFYEMVTSEMYEGSDTLVSPAGSSFYLLHGYPLKPTILDRNNFLKPGELYSQDLHEHTYSSLVETDLFRLVEISFGQPVSGGLRDSMDMRIVMRTSTRQAYAIEPQGIYSPQGSSGTNVNAGNVSSYGLAGNLNFTNRNLMQRGEKFNVNLLGSVEAIINSDAASPSVVYGFQAGGNASLLLPRAVFVDRYITNRNLHKVNTLLNLAYQYENNPSFVRKSLPASITYQTIRKNLNWYYTPLEISFNRNRLDPEFRLRLGTVDSLLVARIFTDHLLTASRFGFVYNNRNTRKGDHWWFVRANLFETSGNLHRLVRTALDPGRNRDTAYRLLGVNYFQYLRSELDVRYNIEFDENNSAVFRLSSGIGLPYGNTSVLPFDKRFFAGGSNSLRAWRPRRVGPGTFSDTSAGLLFDRSGELLFLANVEYRFQVLKKLLEGAIFLDAGNVWNINRSSQLLPGVFSGRSMFSEMAINTGLGFRFDFQFFLMRFDWGIPLRDPAEPLASRWVIGKITAPGFIRNYTALTLGIGYPF